MFSFRALFAALVCGGLILAPALADARAGGGKSMGSRGGNTFQPTPAKPIERSVTQNKPTQSGPAAVSPGSPAGRSPFMSGLMGGLLGAGLVGLIFGSNAWAAEGAGAAGMLGMMLQFALIAAAAWIGLMLFRRLLGGTPAAATAGAGHASFTPALPLPSSGSDTPDIGIADADRQFFGAVLADIQQAWSGGDLDKLRRLVTPEMVSYFAEDLADAASSGVRNVVKNIELLKGDVVDHWVEGDRQYATAVMTWRAIDYVERDGARIGGDDKNPAETTEAWTFMRSGGGKWLLSAIQQV